MLTWRVGRRTVGEPYAVLGAALFWAWPPYLLWKSTRAHGFYGAALVLGLVVLLLALRLHERHSRIDLALLGAALGLGWWATPQITILGVPAVIWLLWQRSSVRRDAWIAVATAVVAALPWLVANLRHDWYSFKLVADDAGEGGRLHNLAVATLPTALGLRLPFSLEWVLGAAVGWLLYAILLGALVWTLLRHRRRLQLFLLTAIAFPIAYALSPYASLIFEPRYLVLVAPVIALVLARAPGSPLPAAALVAALVVLATFGTGRLARPEAAAIHAEGENPRRHRPSARNALAGARAPRLRRLLAGLADRVRERRANHRRDDRQPALRHPRWTRPSRCSGARPLPALLP